MNGVTDADEHKRDSSGTSVTNETTLEMVLEIQKSTNAEAELSAR